MYSYKHRLKVLGGLQAAVRTLHCDCRLQEELLESRQQKKQQQERRADQPTIP